ncbi:MAG: ribonuclease catalytic domain-containing protein [Thermodesulfobacteriota bacterium]
MKTGHVVEYIDRQQIMCAVVLEIKETRLRLLTETNREVNLSAGRLSHNGEMVLDVSIGRDKLVEMLKHIAGRREELTRCVDIKELWEVLNSEQEWIDLATMTAFCFPNETDSDHASAVVRAFFKNRLYFKFDHNKFFPNSEEQVERVVQQQREAERKNRIIENGGTWFKKVVYENKPWPANTLISDEEREVVDILQDFYLFENEASRSALAKAILSRAGARDGGEIFRFLVRLGIWHEDENIDLHRYRVSADIPDKVAVRAGELLNSPPVFAAAPERKDLTGLPLITIDGQFTLDFDDALSIEKKGDCYQLGIHIADVGHFIKKGDVIDQEAGVRGSSIYMPDGKIPMLPNVLAEDLCSLKAGKLRPAISTLARLSPGAEVIDFEIFPSVVNIGRQLTYYEVNLMVDESWEIACLYDIAKKFRRKRLDQGAMHISLPEVNIWIDPDRNLSVSKTNRESPGRMLVAEIMIMANWLMARFLSRQNMPAIFRSQPDPKERLFKNGEGSLFQNWMQRKHLNRFMLTPEPLHHSGLGLDAYVTATSPIRKYFDLATQRQIRAIFGLEVPYDTDEIREIIHRLETPMSEVWRIQYNRNRYWLMKYLEGKIGQKEEAIVLSKRKSNYLLLLTEYMMECNLPLSGGVNLKPQDMVQVTLQHVNARRDVLTVFLG